MIGRIEGYIIHQSGHIDVVNDACKLCYKGKEEKTLERKLKYIEGKIKSGHESVIEHSNVIMMIVDETQNYLDYSEVLEAGKNIHAKCKVDGDTAYYLLGGSIRAYKNIFRNIKNQNNVIAKKILDTLHETPKEYYHDFIQAGIMSPIMFMDSESIYEQYKATPFIRDGQIDPTYLIRHIDNIAEIYETIARFTSEYLFDVDDILDMCTVSVYVTSMSRVITQQLTRHRNAISQQSQRYVDESSCTFINPLQFKDYLPVDTKFKTSLFGELTMDELAEKINSIYPELREQGIQKEDARSLLTQGVESSLYVTFTYRMLIYFLSVRVEEDAQAEIRLLATKLMRDLEDGAGYIMGDNIFKYIMPKYLLAEVDYDMLAIEESIGDIIETVEE